MDKKRILWYILQGFWAFPTTFLGFLAAILLIIMGYHPTKFHGAWLFEVGRNWGGITLGLTIIVHKNATKPTKRHERGHVDQEAVFGIFFLPVIGIPSLIRATYRTIRNNLGYVNKTGYYDIWFEKQASKWGAKYAE